MPLTFGQILSYELDDFILPDNPARSVGSIRAALEDLTSKGYLAKTPANETGKPSDFDEFAIVSGKLSFEISNFLDPNDIAPTLVATDASRIAIADDGGIRRLSPREGLRLFGFPETYSFPKNITELQVFDLLGNSVSVASIKNVATELIKAS